MYTALFIVAMPFVLLGLLRRSRKNAAYRKRWSERFGYCDRPASPGGLWVHAVSVGEFNAAIPLIRALLAAHPERSVMLTCVTPTGSDRILQVFKREIAAGHVTHSYLPFDTPLAVRRFMRRAQPAVGVIIETELWPNLYAAAHRRGVRVVVSNARVSERSTRRFAKVPSLAFVMLGRVSYLLAQSDADAQRLLRLGARADRVRVAGNIKYDLALPESLASDTANLRAAVGLGTHDAPPDTAVFVAGSVHPGEWPIILDAFATLRSTVPGCRLVMVPRHPERFAACAEAARRAGWRVALRSQEPTKRADGWDVLIGDSLGELLSYFGLGQVALVGGSLVDGIGGHNPLEPAALGLPVLFGPYRSVFPEAGDALAAAGAGHVVSSAEEIASLTQHYWQQANERLQAGQRGLALLSDNRGAVAAASEAVAQCLDRYRSGKRLGG